MGHELFHMFVESRMIGHESCPMLMECCVVTNHGKWVMSHVRGVAYKGHDSCPMLVECGVVTNHRTWVISHVRGVTYDGTCVPHLTYECVLWLHVVTRHTLELVHVWISHVTHHAHMHNASYICIHTHQRYTQTHQTGAIARRCNTLQHTATHCNTLQHTATHCNTLQYTAPHCTTLQHTATHCNTLQLTATHRTTLQHTAIHCNTLQHTTTHYNTLQQTHQTSTRQHPHLPARPYYESQVDKRPNKGQQNKQWISTAIFLKSAK